MEITEETLDKSIQYSLEYMKKKNLKLSSHQYEALKALVIFRKDVFVWLPTGFGKSLIFQMLP